MTQQESAAPAAPKDVSWRPRLAHWGRIAISLLTVGFIYPHAMNEDMDLSAIQRKSEGDLYKKE